MDERYIEDIATEIQEALDGPPFNEKETEDMVYALVYLAVEMAFRTDDPDKTLVGIQTLVNNGLDNLS